MRNTLISVVTFILVLTYSAFSFFYIGKFVDGFSASIKPISAISSENYEQVELAKTTFKNKKNTLLLMISKEHIDNIENYLSSLDIAIRFQSDQDIEEYKLLLLNSIENIKKHNSAFS